jgi:hypothetical protein
VVDDVAGDVDQHRIAGRHRLGDRSGGMADGEQDGIDLVVAQSAACSRDGSSEASAKSPVVQP